MNLFSQPKSKAATYRGTYEVKVQELAMRQGPRATKAVIKMLRRGDKVRCEGFYTKTEATTWLLVLAENGCYGYCSLRCLEKL